MYRDALSELIMWKDRDTRKPLVVTGARQVGKTWLLKEFGRLNYHNVAYVLMAENPRMQRLFESTNDALTLISGIEAEVGFSIDPTKTLVILDEIQEVPKAISALKYFYEQTPQYHIVVAGSLLGVALHEGISFPVGKVNSMMMYPMTFSEFVRAVKSDQLADMLMTDDPTLLSSFHESFIELLKQYLFIGGMPEVVESFRLERDYQAVRDIQKQILNDYERDFGKHTPPALVPRIRMVFNSLPTQLSRENKKFTYGLMKKGARAKEFELAIQWLVDAGIILKIPRVNNVAAPLKHYEDPSAFKLFFIDVGLLGALSNLNSRLVLEENALLTEFKGAYAEQFVAQQLISAKIPMHYYSSDNSKIEIDFMVEIAGELIPIEVKAAANLHSKSLTYFIKKHDITRAIKFSLLEEKRHEVIWNEPLYRAEFLRTILSN